MKEMGDLKKFRALRGQAKAKITRIETFVNDPESFVSATLDSLETRRTLLINAFQDYESTQVEIIILDDKDPEATEFAEVVETKYINALTRINEQIKSLNHKPDAASNISVKNLPDIDLSPFDGKDFTKFRPFYELFLAVIDNNKSLTDIAKLFYLRKYLLGDALSVIINLPLEGSSYRGALDLLRKRYDNKCRLITNHVNILLDVQPMQKGTAASIRAFVSQVQQQLSALKNLGQPVDQWDMLLIPILCRKLDQYTNRSYQLDRNCEMLPTVLELITFLQRRAIALEDSSAPGQKINFENAGNRSKPSTSQVVNFALNKLKCCFCDATNHEINKCPKFRLTSIEVREKIVNEHKLCLSCLKPHDGKCKYAFIIICRVCKGSHHALVHGVIHARSSAAHSNAVALTLSDEKRDLHDPCDTVLSGAVTLVSNKPCKNVLLPTAKVKIVDKHNRATYVRALLDSGSQASFVTSALIKQLGLSPIKQTNNKIIGLTKKPTKIDHCVNLNIKSCMETSNTKFNVQCNIVDSITTRLPQQPIDRLMRSIPKNIRLADENFHKPSEVDILLGADLYFKVLQDGLIKLPCGLVLQNTQFGYVVGGGYGDCASYNKYKYK